VYSERYLVIIKTFVMEPSEELPDENFDSTSESLFLLIQVDEIIDIS